MKRSTLVLFAPLLVLALACTSGDQCEAVVTLVEQGNASIAEASKAEDGKRAAAAYEGLASDLEKVDTKDTELRAKLTAYADTLRRSSTKLSVRVRRDDWQMRFTGPPKELLEEASERREAIITLCKAE
jgi:hypothetical protein